MSDNVFTRVAITILVAFGGTFLLVFIIFEYFGITEYVWPIVFPILAMTFGFMFFTLLIVGIVCRAGGGRVPSVKGMVPQTYTQPTYSTYDSPSIGAVYVVPVYCPHCMNKIELDRAEWIGSSDLTCPSCLRVVQAGVRENF